MIYHEDEFDIRVRFNKATSKFTLKSMILDIETEDRSIKKCFNAFIKRAAKKKKYYECINESDLTKYALQEKKNILKNQYIDSVVLGKG